MDMMTPMTCKDKKEIIDYNKRNNQSTYFYTNDIGVKKMLSIDDNPDENGEYGYYLMNVATGDIIGNGKMNKERKDIFFRHYKLEKEEN